MAGDYLDEKIRNTINQMEEQKKFNTQSIYEGITIQDRYYEFQEMSFFKESVHLYLPTAFFDMPEELAKIKYLSSERPKIIKTEDTGSVNITLNLIPNNVCDDQILQVKNGLKTILKRLNPSYLFLEEGVEIIQEKSVGFFEFKSQALDTAVFNLMFFAAIERDVLMGTFNCSYEDYREWRPIAHQIMHSLRVVPKNLESVGGHLS